MKLIRKSCSHHYPYTHEPVFQHNPGEQEDKSFVAAEESGGIRGRQLLQSQQVKVICQSPEDGKWSCPFKKQFQGQTVFPKDPTTFPVKKEQKGWKIQSADRGRIMQLDRNYYTVRR